MSVQAFGVPAGEHTAVSIVLQNYLGGIFGWKVDFWSGKGTELET